MHETADDPAVHVPGRGRGVAAPRSGQTAAMSDVIGGEARALAPEPVADLDAYQRAGGGGGLEAAARLGPAATIDEIDASGLRGRGGAGFPTGRKWRTVAAYESPTEPTTVVVNAAEGEPGSFKDRMILRRDPFRVLEGALIAARAVDAGDVIVAMKRTFTQEAKRVRGAIDQMRAAGWLDGLAVEVFEGPSEYLYGEETGLLEALDGRPPFPRIAPPYRHGVEELVDSPSDITSDSSSAAHVELATPSDETVAPPTLVNNVETMANVAEIVARGADWFRSIGTDDSPGMIVCTITGSTRRHGVAEVAMGTPLVDVIDAVGGGVEPGRRVAAVMSGVANTLLPGSQLDTPVSYEGMTAAGTGLGAGGFIVFDDETDLVAVVQGVSRFLAVESCGQCTPCKQDGLALADLLDRLRAGTDARDTVDQITDRVRTVADSARCSLATQHQLVVDSLLRLFPDAVAAHAHHGRSSPPVLIAPIVDIEDGRAVLDERHASKQPDWTFDEVPSGQSPADRLDEHRAAPAP